MKSNDLVARYEYDHPSGSFTVDEQDILRAGSVGEALEYVKLCAVEQGLQDASIYLVDEEETRLRIARIFEGHGRRILSNH
jgi:hypothetical protein